MRKLNFYLCFYGVDQELIFGTGIAHSVLLLAVVIAVGAALAKVKIAGISLGLTGFCLSASS